MAGMQTRFLSLLARRWREELPELKETRVLDSRIGKGTCFLWTGRQQVADRSYFVRIAFSKTIPSEFSVVVVVSTTKDQLNDTTDGALPGPSVLGTFHVRAFIGRRFWAWRLQDWIGELNQRAQQTPGMPLLPDNQECWKPSSWALPEQVVFDEAISDVTRTIKASVLPVLGLATLVDGPG